jgi:uncharacterized protein (DUF1330 family)
MTKGYWIVRVDVTDQEQFKNMQRPAPKRSKSTVHGFSSVLAISLFLKEQPERAIP